MKCCALPTALLVVVVVTACSATPKLQLAPDEKPMLAGSRVRTNTTINTETFRCYDAAIAASGRSRMNIAVGNIADYTGKVTEAEGSVVTKGGSLMLFSALGLMRNSVRLHDRFDTSVTDLEMTYVNARQLGDGQTHDVNGEQVPWMPYYGGSIHKSEYTILGGITEVNFNLDSGGYSAQINQIGPKGRSFTMSVAADLRMVETSTLVVVATASFQKQFTGTEVGTSLFSFFDVFGDKQLFDVYAGNIAQEPMQLGVRAILEEATLELMSEVTDIDYTGCALPKPEFIQPAPVVPTTAPAEPVASAPASVPTPTNNPAQPDPAIAAAVQVTPAPAARITAASTPTSTGETAAAGNMEHPMSGLVSGDDSPANTMPESRSVSTSALANGTVSNPAPQPKEPAATATATTSTVMVGSFKMESSAAKAGKLLAGIGLTPTIRTHNGENGPIWSVRVFTSRTPATLRKIQSLGFQDAYFLK